MSAPKVSVVLPTFNRPWGLRRAIESALKQNFRDFELLVVDDCSGADTSSVVRAFADARIRYIRQPHNVGIGRNWGEGVRQARSPYLCFLMDDDFYDPSFLENRFRLLEQEPHALLAFSGYQTVDRAGVVLGWNRPDCQHGQVYDNCRLRRTLLLGDGTFVGTMLYRREPVTRWWGTIEKYDLIVDYALNLYLAFQDNSSAVFCGSTDFNMCIHNCQVSQTCQQQAYDMLEELLQDQLARPRHIERVFVRYLYAHWLTRRARTNATRHRGRALRQLSSSIALAPLSTDLWRTWAYLACLILGIKPSH